ncbi:MAG TPA: response regulator [bacterium]|nr:response regulator [bacterium]HPP87093.1 response regulator [bacterium]
MVKPKKKIVITDDDVDTLELLREFLESENFEVFTIVNGIQLFEVIKENKPDIILLDIMMNWISGYDLCRTLKESEKFKDIPIIFISARTSETDIQLGFDSGADAYLKKPFSLKELLEKINSLINK